MNEDVKKMLNSQIWFLGTYAEEPNAVPVFFKQVEDDGTLSVADVFLNKTLQNVLSNGKMAVSVCDADTLIGYQIKGTAQYITEGPLLDSYKEKVSGIFKGAHTARGVLLIKPEKVYVTTPNNDNNKVL